MIRKNSGFTLVELLVVIAIIGTVLGTGITGMFYYISGTQVKSAAMELFSAMQLARLRAVKEKASVVVSFNTGTDSYVAYVDNGAGGGTADNWIQDGGELTLTAVTMDPDVDIYSVTFAGGTPLQVRYNSRGFVSDVGGYAYMRNRSGKNYMGVRVNITGMPWIVASRDSGTSWYDF